MAVSVRLESGTIQMPSAAMLADATILAPLSFQEISVGLESKHGRRDL